MVNGALTLCAMRRTLALTNEAARHPFRRSMPVFAAELSETREPVTGLVFFGASFVSWFIIIMGMIA
jgi:hypothetical protein